MGGSPSINQSTTRFFVVYLRLQSGFDVHVFLTSFLRAHNSENIIRNGN